MWSVEEEMSPIPVAGFDIYGGTLFIIFGFFSWRIFLSSFACMHIGKKYTSAMMITMQNLIFFQQVGDCVYDQYEE
jgi:hypothetical protein